jgi:hypothetical protein
MDWFFKDINSHKKYSRPINIFIFEQLGTPTYSHIMDSLPERELKVNAGKLIIEELEFINMISTSVQQITLMLSQEKLDF